MRARKRDWRENARETDADTWAACTRRVFKRDTRRVFKRDSEYVRETEGTQEKSCKLTLTHGLHAQRLEFASV